MAKRFSTMPASSEQRAEFSSAVDDEAEWGRLLSAEKEPSDDDPLYPVELQPDSVRYSLFELKRLIEEYGEIDLTPEFQRAYVWEVRQQSEFIESILMGIPLPLFYFAVDKKGRYAVVDGLQRLTTVLRFMNDAFPISKVRYLKRIQGKAFSALERADRAKIEKYQIQAYIIPVTTPEQVKLDIFDRINRGGTKLNTQEMRHALYPGKSTHLLKELAENTRFISATGQRLNNKRMRDRYVILRFLALYLWRNEAQYQLGAYGYRTAMGRDFDDFFAQYMLILNAMPDDTLIGLKNLFLRVMRLAYKLFGCEAFTRGHTSGMPFNMMLFESLSYLLAANPLVPEGDHARVKAQLLEVEQDALFSEAVKYSPNSARAMKTHFDRLDTFLPLL